jgi:hypothetical protein
MSSGVAELLGHKCRYSNQRRIQMTKKVFAILSLVIITSSVAGIPAVYSQTSPADFTGEPDKTMAAAHESFVKKDMKKAAEQISNAADYVKKEADKVAKGAKEGVKKASDTLELVS